jgi:hypothetical protein
VRRLTLARSEEWGLGPEGLGALCRAQAPPEASRQARLGLGARLQEQASAPGLAESEAQLQERVLGGQAWELGLAESLEARPAQVAR